MVIKIELNYPIFFIILHRFRITHSKVISFQSRWLFLVASGRVKCHYRNSSTQLGVRWNAPAPPGINRGLLLDAICCSLFIRSLSHNNHCGLALSLSLSHRREESEREAQHSRKWSKRKGLTAYRTAPARTVCISLIPGPSLFLTHSLSRSSFASSSTFLRAAVCPLVRSASTNGVRMLCVSPSRNLHL